MDITTLIESGYGGTDAVENESWNVGNGSGDGGECVSRSENDASRTDDDASRIDDDASRIDGDASRIDDDVVHGIWSVDAFYLALVMQPKADVSVHAPNVNDVVGVLPPAQPNANGYEDFVIAFDFDVSVIENVAAASSSSALAALDCLCF
ncbi:unnamed protein product [Gongylonema pulchrum]|uniref:Uncharacterized protein n=1 Tax=Gongylonema pulchrum TaxID=637853 RepID=A0A183EAR9_9BILA|nr:unnamed protein product [Gongylonema pulchrum]